MDDTELILIMYLQAVSGKGFCLKVIKLLILPITFHELFMISFLHKTAILQTPVISREPFSFSGALTGENILKKSGQRTSSSDRIDE